MMKYFLFLFLPLFLSANLTYTSNYNKELALLESFDIDSSFLYDKLLNKMKASEMSKYTNQHFFKAMDDAYLFIPAIKNILSEYEIPPEFLYLVMAESNFLNRAYSSKKASGLWQFMPETGMLYGLKIDKYVDERRDLVKSTRAAARYLSTLYKQFGKWYLVALAYNCGGGRIERAIQAAKSDDLNILLDYEKKYIPQESRLYIRRILSLALIGSDEQFLLESEYEHLLNRANAYSVSTVRLAGGASLSRLSELVGIPLEDLKQLNRHLKSDFVPPYKDGYDVYIPYIKLSEFKQKYYDEEQKMIYETYVVKNGDKLHDIAKKYDTTYQLIMDFNHLSTQVLSSKQKLKIPLDLQVKSEAKEMKNKSYYMVQGGDTLDSISKIYNISIQNLKQQNDMRTSSIKIGDRLKIYE